ncbi:LPXTG-motif cell wall-anchored protein [Streptomyces sp. 1114.5]|uniref:chaplin n=1 Tax=Streptomyces sp. 1114.5 TaxID=1938830 RepID=UPI000EB1A0C2|nr:chaplin [Streptomyces sp. 1114.5]RKT18744.1 LPXTG-motif cell wall-anchored protein [Streptomyces sp. 1114.5]
MRNVAKKGILTAVATGSVLASTAGYAYAGAEAQGGAAGSPGVASGNSVQVPVEVPINACGNTVDVIGVLNPAYGNHCANVSGGRHAAPPSGQAGQGGHPGSGATEGSGTGGSRGTTASGSSASGTAAGSPGVASGNSVQAPVHVPVNACGNSVNVVGVGNPAFGNDCGNVAQPAPPAHTPAPKPGDDCHEGDHPTPPQTGGETTPSTPGIPRTGGPETGAPATPVVHGTTPGTQAVPAAAPAATPTADSQLASTGAGGVELLGAAGLALLLGGGVLYRRARAGAR